MKSKAKILIVTVTLVAVAGVFLYAPLTNAFQSNGNQESEVETHDSMNFDASCRRRPRPRIRRLWWFLNHSEPVELDGTAVALFKDMLLVDIAEGQIRVHLSRE